MVMAMSRGALVVLFVGLLVVGTQGQTVIPAYAPSPMTGFPPADPGSYAAGGSGYYISYGALGANRAPCAAGAGRSYYTPNCQATGGPPAPYRRGCLQITRCARG